MNNEKNQQVWKVNECFLNFTSDPDKNIQHIVSCCGELMGAVCALYNRIQDGLLHTIAEWNAPPDYNPVDRPEGHICHDVIKTGGKEVFVVRNLHMTSYAETDPNVSSYGLKTYIGAPVCCNQLCVGSLCVVYQSDYSPDENEKKLLQILATALGVEENRRQEALALQEAKQLLECRVMERTSELARANEQLLVDAAERKKAEESVRNSENILRKLFEAIPDLLAVIDRDLHIVRSNWRGGYEYVPEEVRGLAPYCYKAFYPEQNKHCEPCHAMEVFRTGKPLLTEKINSKIGIIEIRVYPIFDEKGEVIMVTEHIRDITERKCMEDSLRESEEKFRVLAETSPAAVFLYQGEKFIYANPATEALTEYTQDELLGMTFWNWTHDDFKELVKSRGLARQRGEPVPTEYEVKYVTKSGEVKWALLSAGQIEFKGKPACIGTMIDITERKQAVEELENQHLFLEQLVAERTCELETANDLLRLEIAERSRAEAEVRRMNDGLELKVAERTSQLLDAKEELIRKEKLAMLGQLAGSVGHELRNPLGVMNNAVYFLKSIITDADAAVMEYLDIIKSEIDNSQRIITDLNDLFRIKPPHTSLISMVELVSQSIEKCAVPDNVWLLTEIPDTLPSLMVDPLQISQVFQHLINNSIQAMSTGGTLIIKARQDLESGTLKTSFIDTGEGISAENMKKLFQPLFTTKARGVGLGLTICRNFTETNGGRIEVESNPGEGTTFTVILPMATEP